MKYARALTRITYPWTDSGGGVECSRCCVPLPGKPERIAAKGAAEGAAMANYFSRSNRPRA
jgi:hypothetical protein